MVMEGAVAVLVTLVNAQGVRLALRNKPKASSWFALGSALLFGLSTRFPGTFGVTAALLTLAALDLSAAGGMLAREMALKGDQGLSREVADAAAVRELMRDVDREDTRRRVAPPDDADKA